MKKRAIGIMAASAFAIAALAAPVAAAPAVVLNVCPVADCDFTFWDGNGSFPATFDVTKYHDVIRRNGTEIETFRGTVGNDTGKKVIYTASSGAPIPADQTCYSFASQRTTPDWRMVIRRSGNYRLVCHFASVS